MKLYLFIRCHDETGVCESPGRDDASAEVSSSGSTSTASSAREFATSFAGRQAAARGDRWTAGPVKAILYALPGWRNGRRRRLKIAREFHVRVRVPPPALRLLCDSDLLRAFLLFR